jgi:hypothetical protein
MATRARAEVGGLGFESLQIYLFYPINTLVPVVVEPRLKIETFSPDSVVPVPKPGVKGSETRTKGRFCWWHVLLRPFVHSCTATCTSIICFSGVCGCNPAVVDAHK